MKWLLQKFSVEFFTANWFSVKFFLLILDSHSSFISWKLFRSSLANFYVWKSKETKFWLCYSLNRTACNCTRCHHPVSYLVMRLSTNLSSHNCDIQAVPNTAVLAQNGLYSDGPVKNPDCDSQSCSSGFISLF